MRDASFSQPRSRAASSGGAGRPRGTEDPLDRVNDLGRRASRIGLAIGFAFALSTHGVASAKALTALVDMRVMMTRMRVKLHEYFWATYETEVEDKKPEDKPKEEEAPPPPPPPPPPPEPAAKDAIVDKVKDDPYEEKPAAPTQASEILTQKQNGPAPVDLSDDGFISGKGDGPGYGYVSADGTAKVPTYDPHARPGGVEGGHGKGDGPPKPKVNHSRPADVRGGKSWKCPFPAEADVQQINRATATIVVTVSPSGSPLSVRVLSDPGYGFGPAARACALGRHYEPALDEDGKAIQSTTPPINVRFVR